MYLVYCSTRATIWHDRQHLYSINHLRVDRLTDDTNVLQYITLPNLNALCYTDFEHDREALQTLSAFLQRSSAVLQVFRFEYETDLRTNHLWFESLPKITDLRVGFDDYASGQNHGSNSPMRDFLLLKLSIAVSDVINHCAVLLQKDLNKGVMDEAVYDRFLDVEKSGALLLYFRNGDGKDILNLLSKEPSETSTDQPPNEADWLDSDDEC